jgi:hypothetical protein
MAERIPPVGSVVLVVVVSLSGSMHPILAMAASITARPSVARWRKLSSSSQISDRTFDVGGVVLEVVVFLSGLGQPANAMARSIAASSRPVAPWRCASNLAQRTERKVGVVVVVVVVAVGGVVEVVEVVEVVVVEVDVVDDVNVVDVVVVEEVAVVDELEVEDVDVEEVFDEPASGPQLGFVSWAGTSLVSLVTPVPSGFMVNRSGPLGAPKTCELDENTILVPSGDHAGSVPPLINRVWPLPSAFITQISPAPLP